MIQLYTVNTNGYEKTDSKHILLDNIHATIINDGSMPDRFYKMLPHKILDTEIAVYCDANMTLVQPQQLLAVCKLLEESEQSAIFFKHPNRTTSRQEVAECIRRGLINPKALQQYTSWRKEGFQDNINLMENNVLIRKINDKALQECEEIWYSEYEKGMTRDQPSLPYAMWKTNYKNFILMDQRIKEEIFKWRPHGA